MTDLPGAAADARRWLERVHLSSGLQPLFLNVAGPRESQAPGIYAAAGEFLEEMIRDAQG